MINDSKVNYHKIPIPDEHLILAINKGIQKSNRKSNLHRLKGPFWLVASLIILTLLSSFSPAFYSFATEVPILNAFVKAMRIGDGGRFQENATAEISTSEHSITFSFKNDVEENVEVPAYSISYHYAPARIQMTFEGVHADFVAQLKGTLPIIKGVKNIYDTVPVNQNSISFVLELEDIYNYELIEYKNPGSLTISLFQDAYYTADEKKPGDIVYFISSSRVDNATAIKLMEKYHSHNPTQIVTDSGMVILQIGNFFTLEEAEIAYAQLIKTKGAEQEFFIDSSAVTDIPSGKKN